MAERAHRLRAEFCVQIVGEVLPAPGGQREPGPADRRDRGDGHRADRALRVRAAAVPAGRAHRDRRGDPAQAPLPRPAPQRAGRGDAAAQRGQPDRPHRAARARLRRGRDAHPDPLHPGGRPRLPGPGPAAARLLVRAAAEPAAVQAAAHGGRDRAVLPDRALLPGRGLPGRPAARVHPARHRDELRRAGRRDRAGGDRHRRALVGAGRLRGPPADPAADLRRGDGPLRLRQARPAVRDRAQRADRVLRRHLVPGLPGALRGCGRDAGRGRAAAPPVRRLAGVGQAARRPRAGLRHRRHRRRAGRPGGQEPVRRRARGPGQGDRRRAG